MSTTVTDLIHRFEPARGATCPPMLLLHGTGGDEDDLLPFGRAQWRPAPPCFPRAARCWKAACRGVVAR